MLHDGRGDCKGTEVSAALVRRGAARAQAPDVTGTGTPQGATASPEDANVGYPPILPMLSVISGGRAILGL